MHSGNGNLRIHYITRENERRKERLADTQSCELWKEVEIGGMKEGVVWEGKEAFRKLLLRSTGANPHSLPHLLIDFQTLLALVSCFPALFVWSHELFAQEECHLLVINLHCCKLLKCGDSMKLVKETFTISHWRQVIVSSK